MPGYVHVCAECGQEMVVPERFLGRDLRCTGCGTGFRSAIPATEIALTASVASPATDWRRWLILGALAAALAVAGVGLSAWLGSRQPDEPLQTRALTLGDGSRPSLHAAFDQPTMVEVGRLLAGPEAMSEPRLRQLLDSYRVIEVPSGTRVQVLVTATGDRPMRVRLLTGRWAQKDVWVQADWVR